MVGYGVFRARLRQVSGMPTTCDDGRDIFAMSLV